MKIKKLSGDGLLYPEEFDYFTMHDEAEVSYDEKIELKPAIQIGWHYQDGTSFPIPFGTYGNFTCLVGPSKSMKSYATAVMVSTYIGGQTQNNFPNIKGVNSEGKWVIVMDTEMSKFHVKRMKNIIARLVGTKYDLLKSFQLRKYNFEEICGFLKWLAYESPYSDNLGLVVVDGAADLVLNTNNEEQAVALAKLLMQITDDTQCHLLTVIHRNFGSDKPRGHLGSEITRKAETVAFIERSEEDIITIKPEYTRNFPFRQFQFRLDDNGIPIDENEYSSLLGDIEII